MIVNRLRHGFRNALDLHQVLHAGAFDRGADDVRAPTRSWADFESDDEEEG